MNKYKIIVKPPFRNAAVWSGPGSRGDTAPVPENDQDRTRREHLGRRIETLSGQQPRWSPRQYCYFADLSEEQVEEIKTWMGVRNVVSAE